MAEVNRTFKFERFTHGIIVRDDRGDGLGEFRWTDKYGAWVFMPDAHTVWTVEEMDQMRDALDAFNQRGKEG